MILFQNDNVKKTAFFSFWYTSRNWKDRIECFIVCSLPHHHQPLQAEPNHNTLHAHHPPPHPHARTLLYRSALLQPRSNLVST